MTAAELTRLAEELGLDAVGAAPVAPYEETERHIRERRGARPLRRHALHDGAARGVVPPGAAARGRADGGLGGALLLRARSGAARRTRRLPRYTWSNAYAELREKLDALGARLGGEYRVLVDENHHVDREAAARAGVGFYGKNTMLITRRHGSWVVLGTLVTEARRSSRPAARPPTAASAALHRRVPDRALDEPGVLDSTRCLSYWTQSPRAIPEEYREALGDQRLRLRHLPGRLSVEPRRREAPRGRRAARREPFVSLVDWLEAPDDELRGALRPPLRPAQRRPLPPAQRAGRRGQRRRRGRARARGGRTRRGRRAAPRAREWALTRIEERR